MASYNTFKGCSQEGMPRLWTKRKGRQYRINCAAKNPITDSLVIKEYRGKKPIEEISAGSKEKAPWECSSCLHQWTASVAGRVGRGYGCPECKFKQRVKTRRENEARKDPVTDPKLLQEYIGETPIEYYAAGSNDKAPWRCNSCQHIWVTPFSERKRGSGCPRCGSARSGKTRSQQRAIKNPITNEQWIKEYRGQKPITAFSASSHVVVPWQCQDCSWDWKASFNARRRGDGCPICAKKRIGITHRLNSAAKNPVTDIRLLHEYRGSEPIENYSAGSSSVRLPWECSACNNMWLASMNDRRYGSGCPECAVGSYSNQKPGVVYLIVNTSHQIAKIGISNNPTQRLLRHKANGYDSVVYIWESSLGSASKAIETAALKIMRDNFGFSKAINSGDGWTETVNLQEIYEKTYNEPIGFLVSLIDSLYHQLDKKTDHS